MPPNAYVLLAATITVVKGALGLCLAFAAMRAIRARLAGPKASEAASTLVSAISLPVIALTVVGVPLTILVMQRWQTELPGAMCLYGVVSFGQGKSGAVGWLPRLYSASVLLTCAIGLLAGCWATCLAIERQAADWPRRSPASILAVCLGLSVMAAASTELAFLSIPRELATTSTGCCVVTSALGADTTPEPVSPESVRVGWTVFVTLNLVLFVCLLGYRRIAALGIAGELALTLAALAGAASGAQFASEVLSTQLLGLPYHPCLYDLFQRMPEVALAFGLYGAGLIALIASLTAGRLYRRTLSATERAPLAQLVNFSAHAVLGCVVIVCMAAALELK